MDEGKAMARDMLTVTIHDHGHGFNTPVSAVFTGGRVRPSGMSAATAERLLWAAAG